MLVKHMHPSGLIDPDELFIASAYQASPSCFSGSMDAKFRHRNGSELPWFWTNDLAGPHIILSEG
jgi:hypothetical protein